MTNNVYVKNYWNYYLELEKQLNETSKFVEIAKDNYNTYSLEYLKLYLAICSEVDVLGKTIVQISNQELFEKNKKHINIQKWGYCLCENCSNIDAIDLIFNNDLIVHPWHQGWKYIQGDKGYKLANKGVNPKWWVSYNKVKHQRVTLTDKENFKKANLENVLNSLGALYILETILIELLIRKGSISDEELQNLRQSILFQFKTKLEFQ